MSVYMLRSVSSTSLFTYCLRTMQNKDCKKTIEFIMYDSSTATIWFNQQTFLKLQRKKKPFVYLQSAALQSARSERERYRNLIFLIYKESAKLAKAGEYSKSRL